ncbi:RHS repeat-associated core domain-containing protein [Nibricoccus sp. IMCC34717]|uniref:RHS repeat-associated core domain-containing protein n=1 Tax=Nibricoccus sp. IMCC34717 TaxID=3034021 RepID=UPI00384D839B
MKIPKQLLTAIVLAGITLSAIPNLGRAADADTLAGSLPAPVVVDNHGNATMALSLLVPAGRAGMQPNLSLNYSSQSGEGLLGVGWSIGTGFPGSITRGRWIKARSGEVRGVKFDTSDNLYLDGKLLTLVSGTQGMPGSVYRTEVDSFVSVTATGGSQIDGFTVTQKNGTKIQFGKVGSATDAIQYGIIRSANYPATPDVTDTIPYAWAIKRVEDPAGNGVDFLYSTDALSGEYVLATIEYTSSPNRTLGGANRFTFSYGDRADVGFKYVFGRRFERKKQLNGITFSKKIAGSWSDQHRYVLNYQRSASTNRLQLKSLTSSFYDTGIANWNKIPDTVFDWSNSDRTSVAVQTAVLPTAVTAPSTGKSFAWGDFNGDGKEDYLDARNGLVVWKSKGNSFIDETWLTSAAMATLSSNGAITIGVADLNGDGKKDVLIYQCSGTPKITPCISTGTGFSMKATFDVEANGRTWFSKDPSNTLNNLGYMLSQTKLGVFSRFIPGDFTGDGRDSILVHGYDGFRYLLKLAPDEGSLLAPTSPMHSAKGPSPAAAMLMMGWFPSVEYVQTVDYPMDLNPLPGDLDGDGMLEYCWAQVTTNSNRTLRSHSSNAELWASYTLGNGTAEPNTSTSSGAKFGGYGAQSPPAPVAPLTDPNADTLGEYTQYTLTGDFNGDGNTDFAIRSAAGWKILYSKGQVIGDQAQFENSSTSNIPKTFSANGETLYTSGRPMLQQDWVQKFSTSIVNLEDPGVANVLSRVQSAPASGTFAMDVNRDGLTDIVWYVQYKRIDQNSDAASTANKGWWAAVSNGKGFDAPVKLSGEIWGDTNTQINNTSGVGLSSRSLSTPDINGDGVPDWVVEGSAVDGSHSPNLNLIGFAYAKPGFADLITAVTDGFGNKTSVGYKAAKDDAIYTPGKYDRQPLKYPVREVYSSQPVVSDIYIDQGTSTDRSHFGYQYSGNLTDFSGRGPLGFHCFVTLDYQTSVFKYQFLVQSFPMTGLVAQEETYRYWEEQVGSTPVVNFRLLNAQTNIVVFDKVMDGANITTPLGSVFPFIAKSTSQRWEDGPAHHQWTKAKALGVYEPMPEALFPTPLDAVTKPGIYVNVTSSTLLDLQTLPMLAFPLGFSAAPSDRVYRTGAESGWSDNKVVSMPVSSFASLPGQITYGNVKKSETDFGDGFTESTTTNYYSPSEVGGFTGLVKNSVSSASSTSFGSITGPTKSYTYYDGTPYLKTESVSCTDSILNSTKTINRDAYYRETSAQLLGGPFTANTTVGSFEDFDDVFDSPKKSRDAYSHLTTVTFDPIWGKVTSTIDPNNQTQTATFDPLGRPKSASKVDFGITSTTTYTRDTSVPVTYPGAVAAVSAIKVVTTTTNSPTVTTYMDRLGRNIRTIKVGFSNQNVYSDSAFDVLGRTIAQSIPYETTPLWTTTTYDVLGRVKTVKTPGNVTKTFTYSGRIKQAKQSAPNLLDQIDTTLTDAKGRLVKVWNADNIPAVDSLITCNTEASVEYRLDGFGQMRETKLFGQAALITATYDQLGKQTSLSDPDKGNWSYLNDCFGRMKKQTDGNGAVTEYVYDTLNRVLSKTLKRANGTVEETVLNYYYDDAGAQTVPLGTKGWRGALARQELTTSYAKGITTNGGSSTSKKLFYYTAKGLPEIQLNQIDGKYFYTYLEYDTFGRQKSVRHYWRPSGQESVSTNPYLWQNFGYSVNYGPLGHVTKVVDNQSRVWWEVDPSTGYDYLDRVVRVKKGNGHWTSRAFRAEDGLLSSIKTGNGSVQDLSFGWDAFGNMTSRAEASTLGTVSRTETFGYDLLNRLTTINGQTCHSYSTHGNVTSKLLVDGSVKTLAYSDSRPHAVSSALGRTYSYDGNGNVVSALQGAATVFTGIWTGFDKPQYFWNTNGAAVAGYEFQYDSNRSRSVELEFDALASGAPSHYTRKRVYGLGATLELNYKNTNPAAGTPNWQMDKVRVYVPTPDGVVGVREFNPQEAVFLAKEDCFVYHYDHLGSIAKITRYGDAGTALALNKAGKSGSYSFTAWGERSNPLSISNTGAPSSTATGGSNDLTPRGYTGHEMLDGMGLVHMNGRIYDPAIGRMLSADILVQNPASLQSFNRYSYVWNNPLRFTDPSGFAGESANNAGEPKKNAEMARKSSTETIFLYNKRTGQVFRVTGSVKNIAKLTDELAQKGAGIAAVSASQMAAFQNGAPVADDLDKNTVKANGGTNLNGAGAAGKGAAAADGDPNGGFSPRSTATLDQVQAEAIRLRKANPDKPYIAAPDWVIGSPYYYAFRWYVAPEAYKNGTGPEYLLDFGYKNIGKFYDLARGDVSPQLKDFVRETGVQLQRALERALQDNPSLALSRTGLMDAAYQSHAGAYERGGFFNLTVGDQFRVGWTPDAGDLANTRAAAVYADMYDRWRALGSPVHLTY